MKLAAFSAGRKDGNTEVYIKEALMAAEELGVEVELYRLRDFELHNCTACPGMCPASKNDAPECVFKDDAPFLIESFLNSDGVIIGGPVYSITPSSLLFTFRDRIFGPKMDVAGALLRGEKPWVKGRFKARPGALISVGGALTHHWVSLGLPSLFSTTFSAQTEVVDFLDVTGVADAGAATMREDYLQKARLLGQRVAGAMLSGDNSWKGEAGGVCPSCHLSLMNIDLEAQTAECAVCGIRGSLIAENGEIKIAFPDSEENRKENRLHVEGKKTHLKETAWVRENVYAGIKDEALERLKKYQAYNKCEVKSPLREARREEIRKSAVK